MTRKRLGLALLMLAGVAAAPGGAAAAEIKLIGSPGVRALTNELIPGFEKATGHKVVADYAVIAILKRRIAAGEAFDVVIPGPELIDELAKQGKVAAGTSAPFGRTGIGLAVRKGAPKPDISTADAFRRAMLDAKVVVHSREGQSGVHFREALKRVGILEQMEPKLRALGTEEYNAAAQKGEMDIIASGMGVVMEMPNVDFIGGLPPELQSYVKFSIGVSAGSKAPEAARALVRYLTSPEVAATFRAKGMERD